MNVSSCKDEQFSYIPEAFMDNKDSNGVMDNWSKLSKGDLVDSLGEIRSKIEVFDWNFENGDKLIEEFGFGSSLLTDDLENWQQNFSEDFSSTDETFSHQDGDEILITLKNDSLLQYDSNSDNRNHRLSESSDIFNSETDMARFDITEYVLDSRKEIKPEQTRTIKAGVKKLDLKGKRYIIDEGTVTEEECEVDIETVSDNENSPVLEAGDLTSLLEQFEATEGKMLDSNEPVKDSSIHLVQTDVCFIKSKNTADDQKKQLINNVKQKIIELNEPEIINPALIKIESNELKIKQEQQEPEQKQEIKIKEKYVEERQGISKSGSSDVNSSDVENTKNNTVATSKLTPNKEILDYLPQEVIDRIRESGKRKPITLIEPIATNKKHSKSVDVKNNIQALMNPIQLDHSYCSNPNLIYKKDSGFVSSEEDDKSNLGRNLRNDGRCITPVVKTSITHLTEESLIKKKKLNLEEYKKRRKHIFKSNSSSQNCSPNESARSSPSIEDEKQKLLKHQEKLKKMAEEVLIAAPKGDKQPPSAPLVQADPLPTEKPSVHDKLPPNLERKVLVSFGVNTDFKMSNNPLAPVERLQEIKPLLEKVSDKINENSLITSLIENIPNLINKKSKELKEVAEKGKGNLHGENKQVLHLEKDRAKTETKSVATQTDISLINQCERGRVRRRGSSSSSCSSRSSSSDRSSYHKRRRKRSESSVSSESSFSHISSPSRNSEHYSRLSPSRSRSRSPRPLPRSNSTDREHLNAVEERRIIYVGRISTGTTKDDLRKKFQKFGPITKISLHFRDQGKNYGFVTFKYKNDAHEAYEHGNNDPAYPVYKISFGGRREFCKTSYSDLDNMRDDFYYQSNNAQDSFDKLLKEAQEKLKRRRT